MKLTAFHCCVLLSLLCHAAGFAALEFFSASAPIAASPAPVKNTGYTILIAPPETDFKNAQQPASAPKKNRDAARPLKPFLDTPKHLRPPETKAGENKQAVRAPSPDDALADGSLPATHQPTNDVTVGARISRVFAAANVQPDYLKIPKPEYPPAARRDRKQGTVLLRVHVTEHGRPDRVEVLRSSGSSTLDDAAIRAVHDWEFTPAQMRDEAVESEIDFPIQFKLDRDE